MVDPVLGDGGSIFDGGGPLSDFTSTAVGYQPSTRTGQDIAAQVRRQFGDEAGVQLLDVDIVGWINDAQEAISNVNRVIKARARLDSIKGVSTYQFPNRDIQQIESLHYNSTLLENVTYAEAEQSGKIGDTITQGQPRCWWEWGGSFTFWPTPPDSQRIDLRYSMRPTRLSSLSDTLGVPDKYYATVRLYVMQQAYELDENFNASQLKSNQFEANLSIFGEEERTAQNMTYETITIVHDPLE